MLLITRLRRKLFTGLGIGALVMLGLMVYTGIGGLLRAFKDFQWWLLAPILVMVLCNYALRFAKWHYYLHLLGIACPWRPSLKIFLSGLSLTVTPGKLGEVVKSVLLKQHQGTPLAKSSPIVAAERLTDLLALVILSVTGVVAYKSGYEVMLLTLALCGGLVAAFSSRRFALASIRLGERLPYVGKHAHRMEEFYQSSSKLVAFRPLMLTTALSVASWGLEALAFWVTIEGFRGVEGTSIFSATFIYAFSTIAGAVTMSPGGLGLTEISMAKFLERSAIPASTSMAATWIIRACTLWFGMLVGSLVLIFGGVEVAAEEKSLATE